MSSLNKAILIGNLTADPELMYSPSGVAISNFNLAVNRPFKNQDGEYECDFIPIVVFRELAEIVANTQVKGNKVAIEGRIQVRTYENSEGATVWRTEVVATDVRFLTPKREEPDAPEARTNSKTNKQPSKTQKGLNNARNKR